MPRRVDNPPNPWHSDCVELLGEAPEAALEVFEEEAKSILSKNDSADLPFSHSVNPYRGCFHACSYCYARPTHEYLDWGSGTDFERRIVVKTNAASLLRQTLRRKRSLPESIAFSGVTDCYQPLEASYRLTRDCLEVCIDFRMPVGIVTKGPLIERDLDLLTKLATRAGVEVTLSIPFADLDAQRAMEPSCASTERRFTTLKRLSEAGLSTGLSIAPLIPGLNDHSIPALLEQAKEAGARRASMTLLRLPGSVYDVFSSRLQEAMPDRASKVLSGLQQMRESSRDGIRESRIGNRMVGAGPKWDVTARLMEMHCKRLGLDVAMRAVEMPKRERPTQGDLFAS